MNPATIEAVSAGAKQAGQGFEQFSDALKGMSTNLGDVTQGVSQMSKPLMEMEKAVGGLKKGVEVAFPMMAPFTEAISLFGKATMSLVMALPNATKYLIDLGKEISQFVKLASPATVMLFNNALNDLHAMIGRGLTPVLELITGVIRNVADSMGFMAKLGSAAASAFKPFTKALEVVYEYAGRVGNAIAKAMASAAPGFAAAGAVMDELAKAAQPLVDLAISGIGDFISAMFKDFSNWMKEIAPLIMVFAKVIQSLGQQVAAFIRSAAKLLGIKISDEPGTKPGSSVGAAATGANVGSLESVLTKAMTSSFSLGTAANSPEMRTATGIDELNKKAEMIYGAIMNDIPNFLAAVARIIGETITKPAGAVKEAVRGAAEDANDFAKRNFGFSL